MNARQVQVVARHMAAAGIEVLGDDQNGNPKYNGSVRLIVRNPATKRRLYYQSYEDARGAAEWHKLVTMRLMGWR